MIREHRKLIINVHNHVKTDHKYNLRNEYMFTYKNVFMFTLTLQYSWVKRTCIHVDSTAITSCL